MERNIQLNAYFQRIARRDKKDFFDEQCLTIEENNKSIKMKSLQENWKWNIKGTFHPKMGTIKIVET